MRSLILYLLLHSQQEKINAQMAELVDALVSNTNEVTLVPVRLRLWVRKPSAKAEGFFHELPKGWKEALGAAVIYTGYVMSSSKLGNDVPMFQKSALMMTGSAAVILLINFETIINSPHIDIELLQWGGFLAIFGTVIPPLCFNTGMPKIGPGLSAILLTLELPAVVLCAYLILGEPVTLFQLIGIAIMIGAIIFLNLSKKKTDKQEKISAASTLAPVSK